KSSYFIGVRFSFRYNFPMVFPSAEMISEARFEDGFSNSSKEGISPKAPTEANKKSKATKAIAPAKSLQNHLIYFEKSSVAFFCVILIQITVLRLPNYYYFRFGVLLQRFLPRLQLLRLHFVFLGLAQ